MKPEIILIEKPRLLLQGMSLLLVLLFIGGYVWKMNEMNLDIPYLYIGCLFLFIFLIARFYPKTQLKITDSGFEYKKGKKIIKDVWSNVLTIGVQGSKEKPYSFFIGNKNYKTALTQFYFIEMLVDGKKEIGYTNRVLDVLKEYSGISPVYSDHYLYNKSIKIPVILFALILLILIFNIVRYL